MHHGPAAKLEVDKAAAKKAKLGVILFLCYAAIYAGFVAIGLLDPDLLAKQVIGKQNLAIVYGFGLIILAMVMGFIYNLVCSRYEDNMNKKLEEQP
jgi:uncharacterized membrane protein (DUF485 family)